MFKANDRKSNYQEGTHSPPIPGIRELYIYELIHKFIHAF